MKRTYITTDLRDAVAAHLESIADLAGIQVLTRQRALLVSEIMTMVAELGLAVIVEPAQISSLITNVAPPVAREARLTITVSETNLNNPQVSGFEAEELAELLLRLLHNLTVKVMGAPVTLFAEERPWHSFEGKGVWFVAVTFRCQDLPAQPVGAQPPHTL